MAEDKPGINLPKVQYRGSVESWNELGSYISRSSSRHLCSTRVRSIFTRIERFTW